jgi:dihydroflavonol-4-reductase
MRVFVTGGAGFIGRAVVRHLRARGDDVSALVRDRTRAQDLEALGARLVAGEATAPVETLAPLVAGHDGLIHLAGSYRIGIDPAEREAMWAANVTAVERVLDAAIAARVPRVVHVSTANVFGNTRGRVVDETYRRVVADGFVSFYDETKYRGHEAAQARIDAGAPIVIAMPGTVYGPGDHSEIGRLIRQAFGGTLRYRALDETGTSLVHVDDEAAGIVAVLDRGRVGESYVLTGPCQRLRDALVIAAELGGNRLPRFRVPTSLLRAMAPLAPRLAGRAGMPSNLAETISASAGVTYWASNAKAARELGFQPRDLATGLHDMLVGAVL